MRGKDYVRALLARTANAAQSAVSFRNILAVGCKTNIVAVASKTNIVNGGDKMMESVSSSASASTSAEKFTTAEAFVPIESLQMVTDEIEAQLLEFVNSGEVFN